MGTVFSHNIMRQFDSVWPGLITDKNLLNMARAATIPLTLSSTLIAAYFRSGHPAGATGYLLIVAFDIVLATVVAPLFGCYYTKTPRPNAALLSVLSGGVTRVILEFALPKDGYLILPYKDKEFLDVGAAASGNYPTFFDVPKEELWDGEQCEQRQFEDYTGVDSLTAFLVSVIVFVTVQFIENTWGPMFELPGMKPYIKNLGEKIPDAEVEQAKEVDQTIKTAAPGKDSEEAEDLEEEVVI